MSGFEELFAAWLAFLAARHDGSMVRSAGGQIALNPPAPVVEIARAEREIGHALPADMHALYAIANGQPRLDGEPQYPDDIPVFAALGRFLSLEQALEERRRVLETSYEGRYDEDWYPISSDGKGGGVAIDLVTDASTARGRAYRYGKTDKDLHEVDYSLRALLQGMLGNGDRLSLYRNNRDPLLRHLKHWYHDRVDTPNSQIEDSMQKVLEPWLQLDSTRSRPEALEHYLQGLALQVAFDVYCNAPAESTLKGVQIANDWLYEQGMITERRHKQAEAIRVDRDGARTNRITDYEFTSGENGGCAMGRKF